MNREKDGLSRAFHKIPHFQDCSCCDKLRERSRQLIGELIFIDEDPTDNALISIFRQNRDEYFDDDGVNVLSFFASNTMTEATAFGLLHMLHHLRDTAYRYSNDCLLNERVLELLSGSGGTEPYRFNCGYLDIFDMPTMAQLAEISKRIRFNRVEVYEAIRNLAKELETPLQICAGGGQVCREVVFDVGMKPAPCTEAVNSIIEACFR